MLRKERLVVATVSLVGAPEAHREEVFFFFLPQSYKPSGPLSRLFVATYSAPELFVITAYIQ